MIPRDASGSGGCTPDRVEILHGSVICGYGGNDADESSKKIFYDVW